MHSLLVRIFAGSLAVFVLAAGVDLTLALLAPSYEQVYPVDLADLPKKKEMARRTRVESESELEESAPSPTPIPNPQRGESTNNSTPLLRANPFTRRKEEDLPAVPMVTGPDGVNPPPDPDHALAKKLDQRDFKLSAFSADPAGVVAAGTLSHCKAVVERTLQVLPSHLTASLDTLTLYFNHREPRGLSNSHQLELTCGGLSDSEIVSVLVHELGHIADLGAFRGASDTPSGFVDGSLVIPLDDSSVDFYKLSWQDSHTTHYSAQRSDFISGYAMSDPFEDFAESFIAYILHGDDFRTLAAESEVLQAKYDFLKQQVFAGAEYESAKKMRSGKRVWDVTLIEADLGQFWSR